MTVPRRDGRQPQQFREQERDDRGRREVADRDRERAADEQRRREVARAEEEVKERRRQDEDRRRRQEEDRKRLEREEEQRRQREEETRRREAAERRRREEEEARRKEEAQREAERRRKEEERRRAEEEQRKKETAAALSVRKVVQRVRVAAPETYDQLRTELEEALEKNREAMGPLASKVQEEAEQTLKQAQRRIDEINEKRAEDERRREEEERRRAEEREKVEAITKEAAEQAATGDQIIKQATDAAEKIPEIKDATPESIVAAADAASKVYEESRASLEKVLAWFAPKRQELTDNHASRASVMDLGDIQSRLEQGKKTILSNAEKAKTAQELAKRKATAMQKTKERRLLFEKRDVDKDGKLNQEEVVLFSKEVHSFEVPQEVLAKILLVLEPVTFEKFHALHQKVAIAKLESEARARRAKLEAERQAFQKVVDEIEKHINAAETGVSAAETDAKPLSRDMDMPAAEMKATADKAQLLVEKAEEDLKSAQERLKQASEDCASNAGLNFEQQGTLQHRRERAQTRAERVSSTVKRAAEQAVKKAAIEVDTRLTESVSAAHKLMTSESKTSEQLFEGLGGSALTLEKFTGFVKGLPDMEISDAEAERLFAHVTGKQGAEIDQALFVEMLGLFYKVVRGTVLAEGLSIKTKTVRRLEDGELLVCLEGPCKDESCGVQRVKCRASSDSVTGWVTLQGNQGTPFLVQDGNFISVRERLRLAAEKAAEEKRIEAEKAERLEAEKAAAAAAAAAAAEAAAARVAEEKAAAAARAAEVAAAAAKAAEEEAAAAKAAEEEVAAAKARIAGVPAEEVKPMAVDKDEKAEEVKHTDASPPADGDAKPAAEEEKPMEVEKEGGEKEKEPEAKEKEAEGNEKRDEGEPPAAEAA